MSEFSPIASPIASLARSYGITNRTPDHGELRSTPRWCSSSGHDQHVNTRGRTQGTEGQKQSRASHREMAVHDVWKAFGKSLEARTPQLTDIQKIILVDGLRTGVNGVITVGLMRRLVQAESENFKGFKLADFSDTKRTSAAGDQAVLRWCEEAMAPCEDALTHRPPAFTKTDDGRLAGDKPVPLDRDQVLTESDFATPSQPAIANGKG